MICDEDPGLPERVEKLERRADDVDSALVEILAVPQAIVDGPIERAKEPHALVSIAFGAVAVAVLRWFVLFAALNYLSRNPIPFGIQVPPPHSTQLPKERP